MNKAILFCSCAVVGSWMMNAPASAQSASAAVAAPEYDLEEVIVTAQRREERLQNVPISISAITEDALKAANVTDTRSLMEVVPNLTFTTTNFSFQPTLRGVGTRGVTQGDEPNVAVYLDGIYQPDMAAGSFSLLQVRQVEVLRGPQGTLFGRNATGGLINVITQDPVMDPSGKIEVGYGRFDTKSVRGYVTGALGATVAADFAWVAEESDGYIEDLVRGGEINPSDNFTGRSKILFTPSDTTRIVVSGGYSHMSDPTSGASFALNGNSIAKLTNNIKAERPYVAALDYKPSLTKKKADINLQTTWDFESTQFATATSYQWFRYHNVNDSDGTVLPTSINNNTGISDSYQQEIRLLSTTDGDFSWIVGGYGFLAHARHDPLILGSPAVFTTSVGRNRTESVAGFAEGHYGFDEDWSATLGLRYTTEKRQFTFTRNNVVLINGAKTSYDQFTPKASIQHTLGDLGMVFASYSKGFKSGVFNTTTAQAAPTRPETLDAYEIGTKLDPTPHLRANFAVFYYKYKDIQLSARDATTPASTLLNAARSTIKGAEAEFTAAVTPRLQARLNLSLLDAQYDSFPNAVVNYPRPGNVGGNVQIFEDESGKNMIRSPKSTASFGLNYTQPLTRGSIVANGNLYWTDKFYWDFQNRLFQPSYVMVNAEVAWLSDDERYRVGLWGKNLANEVVYQALLPSTNLDAATVDKPRTFGVTVSVNF